MMQGKIPWDSMVADTKACQGQYITKAGEVSNCCPYTLTFFHCEYAVKTEGAYPHCTYKEKNLDKVVEENP